MTKFPNYLSDLLITKLLDVLTLIGVTATSNLLPIYPGGDSGSDGLRAYIYFRIDNEFIIIRNEKIHNLGNNKCQRNRFIPLPLPVYPPSFLSICHQRKRIKAQQMQHTKQSRIHIRY